MFNSKVKSLDSFRDSDGDDDYSESRVTAEDVLKAVQGLGEEFTVRVKNHLDHGAGTDDKHPYRAILKVQNLAKSYLMGKGDQNIKYWRLFEATYGKVRVDKRSAEMKLGKKVVTEGQLINELEDALGVTWSLSEAQTKRKMAEWIKGSQFDPVQKYLEGLPTKLNPEDPYGYELADWEPGKTLAKILFGSDDPLDQIKLTKWLVGAVERAMNPGCQMDSALVIKGGQGIGKTTFLRVLFGEHFVTLHSDKSTIEQQRMMRLAWGCELGEIESTFRAKDIAHLKAVITETVDIYRDLFENSPTKKPRHCVLAGTTNESQFLNDPTGSRRFWVIDAGNHKIDVKWVAENRDRIWGMAYSLGKQGMQHWLTDEEMVMDKEASKVYQVENQFQEVLGERLEKIEEKVGAIALTASDVFELLKIPVERRSQKFKKEVSAAMKNLGYVRTSKSTKTLKGKFYIKPDSQDPKRFDLRMTDHLV